jgi:tripartite-type tricarboxylate transporter receptor subunit TctC
MDKFIRMAAACALSLGAASAAAQYPGKPIRLIVPFPPGGAADAAARIVAQPLTQTLGQLVTVDNRPGADGAIAADAAMKSPPDGYTLFFATNTAFCSVPALRKNPPYDPVVDFAPISLIGKFGFFLFVHSDVPANTLPQLLDYARANPGKLNYGTGNSTSIIATAQLKLLERLDMVQVPYKGDAPATADLVAGRVQLMFATPTAAIGHVKDGRLRALAVLGAKRSPLLPEIPTTAELGLAQLSIQPWAGLFGPAKLPREIADRLSREMRAVVMRPEVREQLDRQAFDGQGSTPEELATYLKEQIESWKQAARAAGIQPD